MSAPFTDGCRCGAIRYRCTAEPMFAAHGHCRDCQYSAGGPYATVVGVPREAVTIEGQTKSYTVEGESGNTVTRRFCSECGTPVFSEPNNGAMFVIKAGSLDDPSWIKPAVHIGTDSAQPWTEFSGSLPKIARQPG